MNKKKYSLKKIFLLTVAGAIALSIAIIGISYYALSQLTFAQDMIFHGKKFSDVNKEIRDELLKRPYIKQINFKTSDNLSLAGLFVKRDAPRANVILCHGYRCSKEMMFDCIDLFPEWNLLLFDFRAHGQSEGAMTTIGCNEDRDVLAAVSYMKEQAGRTLPLVIIGVSMGGAATIKAVGMHQKEPLCDALVIDSSYADLYTTILHVFTKKASLPRFVFLPIISRMMNYFADCTLEKMAPVENVSFIKQPIFFIHSRTDTFIHAWHSIRLFGRAQHSDTNIWIAPPCRHGSLHTMYKEEYGQRIREFISKTVFHKKSALS